MQSIFKALNYPGEQTITYEQIGRLGAWATDIETTLDNLQRLAKNMQEAVLHDLPPIAMSGRNPHVPRFNQYGGRSDSVRSMLA
jgi:hypothetical protein